MHLFTPKLFLHYILWISLAIVLTTALPTPLSTRKIWNENSTLLMGSDSSTKRELSLADIKPRPANLKRNLFTWVQGKIFKGGHAHIQEVTPGFEDMIDVLPMPIYPGEKESIEFWNGIAEIDKTKKPGLNIFKRFWNWIKGIFPCLGLSKVKKVYDEKGSWQDAKDQ